MDEINNLTSANSGFVTLIKDKKHHIISEFCEFGVNKEELNDPKSFINEIINAKEGGIVNDHQIDANTSLSILYSPFLSNDKILGSIVLVNDSSKQFTAAQLKLLSTLSTQSAAAIESTTFNKPNCPIYQNVTGTAILDESAIKT